LHEKMVIGYQPVWKSDSTTMGGWGTMHRVRTLDVHKKKRTENHELEQRKEETL